MNEHTRGPWIDSERTDAIIAPNASDEEKSFMWPDSLQYYGGYVICESMADNNRSLIKAAPELLEKLELINNKIDNDIIEYAGPYALYHVQLSMSEILEIRELLKRAKGEI